MKKIVFASRNRGKIQEIQAMLAYSGLTLKTMNDYPDLPEIVEDGKTFLENALKKARTIAELTGEICLADDSGLEVAALGGAPGIYSSRYAGDGVKDDENNRKLLDDLKGVRPAERDAAFRCILVLCRPDGRYHSFDGRWTGRIAEAPAGKGGFGYDPVFYLPGQGVTVAELPPGIKNRISHRAEAFAKLNAWLQKEIEENGA
ncbi:MAG: XTP/dITP diphosphatase [Syntrophales bacterium]